MWFLFSFISAFSESLKDVFSKKSLQNVDEYIAAIAIRIFALPVFIGVTFFTGIPELKPMFWMVLGISAVGNTIATIVFMKAIKLSDLSVSIPLIAFTPLFMIFTSPIMIGESYGALGILGIVFIVLGAYFLNMQKLSDNIWAPFKALYTEKGPRLMFLLAFIWSITSNIDKVGIVNSSPVFWSLAVNFCMVLLMIPVILKFSKKPSNQIVKNIRPLIAIGVFNGISSVFHMLAILTAQVAFVISIKRISGLFGVLFGYLFFKERNLRNRLLGAFVMIIGVIIIAFSK
jgi:uncharacterized membrane protein